MPDPMQNDFNLFNQKEETTKHRSIQFAGLYCLGSPESWHYRVVYGKHKPAVKIGKSVDILKRFNEYRLYYPFAHPDMKVHCMLMMPHAVTKEQKSNLDRAETFVLSQLKAGTRRQRTGQGSTTPTGSTSRGQSGWRGFV